MNARRNRIAPLLLLSGALIAASSAVAPSVAQAKTAKPASQKQMWSMPRPAPLGAVVPSGTAIRFAVDAPLSSADSQSGTPFTFTLLDPILVMPVYEIPAGTTGKGLLVLAGHAGPSGHEGDLTLQIVSLAASKTTQLTFAGQRFEINGKNAKVTSGVLGFVPFVGLGAHFIRGEEVTVTPATPVLTVTLYPASITRPGAVAPDPSAAPSAAPSPTGAPSASPAPSPSPTSRPSRSR